MPAYLIADTDITDPERYEEYKRQAAPLVERFGGRYCARGSKHEVLIDPAWENLKAVAV